MTETNKFNFKDINISPKDFIAGLVFVFTMSGVWYKVYFEADDRKVEIIQIKADMRENNSLIRADMQIMKSDIESLKRAELVRATREEMKK